MQGCILGCPWTALVTVFALAHIPLFLFLRFPQVSSSHRHAYLSIQFINFVIVGEENPTLCTLSPVTTSYLVPFCSFTCSTVILVFNSFHVNTDFLMLSVLLCYLWKVCVEVILFIPKPLMEILFLWVKNHIRIQEFKAFSILLRNLKGKRQHWKLQQHFLTFK